MLPRSLQAFELTLDEPATFEPGAGTDQGDQVRCVDCPPPVLGGLK